MMLLRGGDNLTHLDHSSVATIGNFDGFHLGHQEICKYVMALAKEKQSSSALITFEPTPKEFFSIEQAPARIYPLRKKFEIARDLGFDYFVCLRFNQTLAQLPAVDFVHRILHDAMRIKALVIGDDFKFGHKRKGDIQLLRELGSDLGFRVSDQSKILHEHDRISSTLLRTTLADSNFKLAAKLMGRTYTLSGRVFHGDKKGRTIGFPTANIALRQHRPPISGVFAISATNAEDTFQKNAWQGVANIGTRPTVNGKRNQLEVHLFNCHENLYGRRLSVEFLHKLRDETKFSSLSKLQQQIIIDVEKARQYFSQRK